MVRFRRLAVLAGAVALAGAFVAGPAQADSPEVFFGSAAGTALDLSVLDKQAAAGHSEATVDSAGTAKSLAKGLLLPEVGAKSEVKADAAPGQTVDAGRVCQNDPLPAQLADVSEILNLGLVCGAAKADNTDEPSASAEGSIAELDLSVASVVTKVEEKLAEIEQAADLVPIGGTLAGLLDQVCEAEPDATEGAVCDATTPIRELVETVLKTQVVDVELGKSTASVTTGQSTVTSEATAAGGTIKILPSPQVEGLNPNEPLVTISIGDAKATTVYDRGVGSATAAADPAIVRIKLNSALVDKANEVLSSVDVPDPQDPTKSTTVTLKNEIPIGPAELANLKPVFDALSSGTVTPIAWCDEKQDAVCILPGTPLESRVWFASASTKVNADGSAEAEAHAVRVDLLVGTVKSLGLSAETTKMLPAALTADPVVHLSLAHAKSVVGGRQAQITRTTDDDDDGNCPPDCPGERDRSGGPGSTEPPLELPRTGGLPFVPMLGSAGLALAVLFRRALVKASR